MSKIKEIDKNFFLLHEIKEWLRYNRRIRRILLNLSDYIFEDQILKWLYPDDCVIVFR